MPWKAHQYWFGDGSDGDVTIAGTVTLTRDMSYRTLTITGANKIVTAGFRLRAQVLDLSGANAGAIQRNGNAAVTQRVAVVHGSLVMEAGRQIGAGYTLLNYLGITGVSPSSPDGLDDLWQTANFGSATNALAAPSADPDGDGANNFAEFHFGTLPNSGGSRPFLNATLPSETKIQLQWSSASNHVFRLEQSTNLIAWTTAVPQCLATNSLSVATLPRIPGSPQGFFRIVPIAP